MKKFIKPFIPGAVFQAREQFLHRYLPQYRLDKVNRAVARHCDYTVISGPFQGMRYGKRAFCGGYAPKLLGCYEAELHGVLEEAFARDYDTIVDIGAAEGYYAVGFALRFPARPVYAFELDNGARKLCEKMIQLNQVEDQVTMAGACDVEALRALPLRRALVICDCEGAEFDLLRPEEVPTLAGCDLLVEMHDCYNPRITPALLERFGSTHDVALVPSEPHRPEAFPIADFLPVAQRSLAVDDLRGAWMEWAWMTARTRSEPSVKT